MPTLHALTPEEYARYGRHIILPEVGPEGQRRLGPHVRLGRIAVAPREEKTKEAR